MWGQAGHTLPLAPGGAAALLARAPGRPHPFPLPLLPALGPLVSGSDCRGSYPPHLLPVWPWQVPEPPVTGVPPFPFGGVVWVQWDNPGKLREHA